MRAPSDGVIAASWREEGERVQAGSPLVRLLVSGQTWVRFAVKPGSPLLEVGAGAEVVVFEGPRCWRAEVRHVAPEVTPEIGRVLVEAVLSPAQVPLRPGQAVRLVPGPR